MAGDRGIDGRNLADHDIAGRAVDRDEVADFHKLAVDIDLALHLVDGDGIAADDAGLAPTAGDHGRMAGLAAGGREDALGQVHAGHVLGTRLLAHQQDRVVGVRLMVCDGGLGREDDLAAGRARAGGDPLGDDRPLRLRVELGQEQVVQAVRADSLERCRLVDEFRLGHLDGDPHGGRPGPLAGPGLQHVEGSILDRELDVLHLLVVRLQLLANVHQLLIDLRHLVMKLGDRLGGANAGHHVLTLGVDQVIAEELVLAAVRISCERHARARVVAGVAEHHGLNVDRRALEPGDPLDPAVLARPCYPSSY